MSPKNHPQAASISKLTKLRLFLLYSFPAVLFCSYFPVIPLFSAPSTNYELSLPLIWLLLFSVLSLKDFAQYIYNIYKKNHLPILPLLFPLYLAISTLWSANPLRAILTAGILWCLIITSVVIFTTFRQQRLLDTHKFLKIFFFSSGAFCLLCWLQSLLDCLGVGRETTLLCSGCTSYSFGFPHPSGFAIEPQFMGNLLLAPTLFSLFLLAQPKLGTTPFKHRALLAFTFLFSSTLFLTFSRGAIYSFTVGFIVLFVLEIFKLKNRRFWRTLPLLLASGFFVILAQGVFSALSPTSSTFLGGVERSISQMTLGKVNLHLEPEYPVDDEVIEPKVPSSTKSTSEPSAPIFSGYVEESTDVRMNFNRIALELSAKSAERLLFGYGLASAGEAMYQEGKTAAPLEIIQNEYLSLLLETGLVGLLLALLAFIYLLSLIKKLNRPESFLLVAIVSSSLFSLLFFSGLPNALHLYLFPVFLAAIFPSSSRRQTQTCHTPRN